MKAHYTEADLLETYYMQPGESMPVMMHLADCSECAARYESLDRKLRESAVCHSEKPEGFWSRQKASILRRVDEDRRRTGAASRVLRLAAAAVLAFVLGGYVVYDRLAPSTEVATPVPPPVAKVQSAQNAEPAPSSPDPWESEELKDFQSVVEWESWIDPQSGGTL